MAGDDGKKADREFQVITSAMDDCRRQIAAGKVQRWDVVKWGVAVNTALATVAVLRQRSIAPFLFALAVAVASGLLVWHYNKRMTGARRGSDQVTAYFHEAGIDLSKIIPVEEARGDRTPGMYDAEELYIFGYIIGGSILPAFLAWVV